MATLPLLSLAKKETILSLSVTGPAVDTYALDLAVQGLPVLFEGLLWDSAPAESLTNQYPAASNQAYDWSSAPDWAQWAAFDETGFGHWFRERPVLDQYNGRWRAGVTEKRSWPMTSNVALTRGWRASLGFRPVSAVLDPYNQGSATLLSTDCSCPTSADTVTTDVTGYIAVTMGEAILVPDSCQAQAQAQASAYPCAASATATQPLPGAAVLLQESDDGLDWTSFGRLVLTSINSPVSFTYTPTKALIRASVSSIWGANTFATVTVSSPV